MRERTRGERVYVSKLDYPYNSERDDWIQSMVLAGLGFTIIPEYAVTYPELVVRPLVDPEFERRIFLATIRGRPYLPTVRTFIDHVRRYSWNEMTRSRRKDQGTP